MREIRFRAKGKVSGKWFYGYVIHHQRASWDWSIFHIDEHSGGTMTEIDPKTVGEYTGLKIKGVELYEGDIIKTDPESEGTAVVEYHAPRFCHRYPDWDMTLPLPVIDDLTVEWSEIVGNIYENPELLKEAGL